MAPTVLTSLVALPGIAEPIGGLVSGIQTAIGGRFDRWVGTHQVFNWLVGHPLSAIGLGLFSLFLFAGLISAIGRLGEQLWLKLLKSPIAILSGVTAGLRQTVRRIRPDSGADRLGEILDRLEELRQEESALMEELGRLVKTDRQ